jgi:putative ABC transport system permease protein
MRTLSLAWRYLWSRPLGAVLNLLLLSLGLASITFLLLLGHQLSRAFERDLAGIDLVAGAKGSPLQLILSGVLHLDVPTGNVPLQAVQELEQNPLVASVIPISLGDSFRGFRIVGTSHAYPAHYQATLAQGTLWQAPMQAVLGASAARALDLQVGSSFVGSHGLGAGGHSHGDMPYTVTGVLVPTGSVLDRLILTDTASVWRVHETATALDADDQKVLEQERELTLALVRYRSPLAAVTLPRFINSTTEMQAAAPALEISRLLRMLGVGTEVLQALAGVLLLTAALSVFLALWTAVRERRADLALLRMLGAPPRQVAALLLTEALWLGLMAAVLGLLLGQGLMALLGRWLALDQSLLIGGLAWPPALGWVPAVALTVSLVSAILPALGAFRVSVHELLQHR